MKKRLALLLAFATLFTLISVHSVSAADDVNIAAGKSYTASPAYTDRTYPNDYQLIDGKELTDGVKGTTDFGTEWHGFYNQSSYFAKVDLGMKYPGIKRITMQFSDNSGASVLKPKSVELSISSDNKNFTSVGLATATRVGSLSAGGSLYEYTLQLTTAATARFVKAVIARDSGMFVFACEFEVFNSGEAGTPSLPGEVYPEPGDVVEPELDYSKINVKPETGMFIEGDYIYGAQLGTYYDYMLSQFIDLNGLVIKDKDGNVKTSGVIGTGDIVEKITNETVTDSKTFVIDGDIDGDGGISSMDYLLYKKAYLGNHELKDAYLAAAHISNEDTLDTIDLLKMKKQILGNFNIYMSKYAEAVMIYPMSFTKSSESSYIMETKYGGKKLSLTFDKKDWGTWNIGTLTYDGNALAGAGTDWEYVYRVGDSSNPIAFCGGNHGNEALKELKFYDGAANTELVLETGVPEAINSLKIVEKTQILFNNSTTPWCDVVRTYYIAGNRIELLVDYKFIKDCKFDLSYTCMFPVLRDYGTHSLFYNIDGSKKPIDATPKDQYRSKYPTDFTGPYLGQLSATKVKLWGEKNPEYSFDVQVYDVKTSCNNFDNAQKTFLWDMSLGATKLYFSKFKLNDTVAAGTTWRTKSTWAFYVEPAA